MVNSIIFFVEKVRLFYWYWFYILFYSSLPFDSESFNIIGSITLCCSIGVGRIHWISHIDQRKFYFQVISYRPSRAWSKLRHRRPSKYPRLRPNSWTLQPRTHCNGSTSDASWPRLCSPNGYWCQRAAPRRGIKNCFQPPTRPCLKENRPRSPWTLV